MDEKKHDQKWQAGAKTPDIEAKKIHDSELYNLNPWSPISTKFLVFDPAHNKQLASVILALITCRSFYYYVVNYKHEKKIIVFLRKLLVQLGQGNTDNKYIIQSNIQK